MKYTKGQITFGAGALITVGTVVSSILASYYTAQNTQADNLATVKESLKDDSNMTKINIARIDQRVTTVEKTMDRFENKIDALLRNQGLNPERITAAP